MMAQQTKARMAVRGCRRPWRLRGSGISAKKESRLLPSDASMLRLRAAVQRKAGYRRHGRFSYPPNVKLSTALLHQRLVRAWVRRRFRARRRTRHPGMGTLSFPVSRLTARIKNKGTRRGEPKG